ncbi:hypothetical protein HYH02_009623 [Chlamydomonas schloesseri]|uniref:Uncharacterized protein n=1 Tax=Chlamydomonas schloesseri TaxID=2026947 RepID=A0A835W7C0_9CHLO|nr:hypothetical protein HYH02_009623 [Chlamydomonas schloesseri]|eukprot:KAG2442135.1 hypothetical protein HYH02_009623 [Chlamydomonas schloesseri]
MHKAICSEASQRGSERGLSSAGATRQPQQGLPPLAARARLFPARAYSRSADVGGSSLPTRGTASSSRDFIATDVVTGARAELAAAAPDRHHSHQPSAPTTSHHHQHQQPPVHHPHDDFSHAHTSATSPASGSVRLTGGSHTRPANSSLAAHGCYRVVGPARICKRGDTLVAHLFPGGRLELLDRDGNATSLGAVPPHIAAAAVLPYNDGSGGGSSTTATVVPMPYTDAYTVQQPYAVVPPLAGVPAGAAGPGSAEDTAAWSAGGSLFSIADEDVPAAAAVAGCTPAAAAAAAAVAAAPLISSGVGGGIGSCCSAGMAPAAAAAGRGFPAPGSPELAAAAQRVVEECVLVAAHVELGGSASSVDLVDLDLQPAVHHLNGHTYLSVRCMPPSAVIELAADAQLCHPINMTPPADTCC